MRIKKSTTDIQSKILSTKYRLTECFQMPSTQVRGQNWAAPLLMMKPEVENSYLFHP
jgi:hypothetical protein